MPGITALLLLLCGGVRPDLVETTTVDLVELNHFYDENGRLVFDQVIFYDWSSDENRFQVRAWRLLKHPSQVPTYNSRCELYEAVWHDGDVLRRTRSARLRESWTQYDPELRERAMLSREGRRELPRPRLK